MINQLPHLVDKEFHLITIDIKTKRMKQLMSTLFLAALCCGAATAQEQKTTTAQSATPAGNPAPAGKFKFMEENHNFGDVPEGPNAECDFVFENVGSQPIVISNAAGSCGCTVPTWPKEPIMPGKKGTIHVSYNTNGRQGMISKVVTLTSNAEQQQLVLHISGNVLPKPAEPVAPAVAPKK